MFLRSYILYYRRVNVPREYVGHAGNVLALALLYTVSLKTMEGAVELSDAHVYLRREDRSKLKYPVYTKH